MYPEIQKKLLISAIVIFFIMTIINSFTHSITLKCSIVTIGWTILVLTPIVMYWIGSVYTEGTGRARSIEELILDCPYRVEAVGSINNTNYIWLRRITVCHTHYKLILDQECLCYYTTQDLTNLDSDYVISTLEYGAPYPALEVWNPPRHYSEYG